MDGNEAVASVGPPTNEVIAIYPITPASPMGELADAWSADGRNNIFGARARGHRDAERGRRGRGGARRPPGRRLATTFTASQGLLLMIPNMYKIAGELTPAVHPRRRPLGRDARAVHLRRPRDVMAVRATGWAMLALGIVQEAHDFALIAQAATLESRVPFLHFFDGFRTSHEVAKIEPLAATTSARMIDEWLIAAHRERALSPDHPVLRGTAQNPDVFFQAREAINPYYVACPGSCRRRWTGSPGSPAGGTGSSITSARRMPSGSSSSWARGPERSRRRSRPWPRAARRSASSRSGSTGRSAASIRRRAAGDRASDRRPRPHQGAGRRRRAALPGRGDGARGGWHAARRLARARASSAAGTGCLQGVHAAMVAAVFDELTKDRAEAALHRRHRRRRHAPEPHGGPGVLDRADDVVRAVFSGSAATARSAPTRTR